MSQYDDPSSRAAPAARERLVLAALRLFAEKGYEGATTREIAESAGANLSAIRYYFGDKAGLYRASFTEPMGEKPCQRHLAVYPTLPTPAALRQLLRDFLEPLKQGETLRLVMRLHFREMTEPTGAWQEVIDREIKPLHDTLVCLLECRLGPALGKVDAHRLAFAILGMAVHFYVGQPVIAAICPAVAGDSAAIDVLAERLAGYALAMIESEAQRLADGAPDGAG